MKKNKIKVKKGMTLIEVIISVTLLSILIVPISTIVITSLRSSKDGEYKQKASYIGQKVLEELKSYDYITLQSEGSEKYFQLLDGDKIKKISEDIFTGNFERTIFGTIDEVNGKKEAKFEVEVRIEKSSDFNFEDSNYLDEENSRYIISFEKKDGLYKVIGDNISQEISSDNNIVIEVNDNYLSISNNTGYKIDIPERVGKDNSLFIKLKNTYDKETTVEARNNLSDTFEINLINGSSLGKLNIISSKGNIILSEINEINNSSNSNMYNYEVIVKNRRDEILFQGKSSNNIIIR
jgi:prepilin-type N-terminal cleavage/methylation domain-containing protein